MNKTDRLLAILLELQQRKVMRAEDLASLFEMSVRTIYRDIQALSEAGVPVIRPRAGYSLMEGTFAAHHVHGGGSRGSAHRNGFRRAAL